MCPKPLLISQTTPVKWHRLWDNQGSVQPALWAAATIAMDHHATTELVGKSGAGLRRDETGDGDSLS